MSSDYVRREAVIHTDFLELRVAIFIIMVPPGIVRHGKTKVEAKHAPVHLVS